jgi:hypothetical protein
MQFTRIRKTATLFEFTFCNEALENKKFFAMWPLGAAGRRGLAKFRRGLAGVRPGRVGERSTGHWHSVSGVGRGRGGSGGGAHRQPAVASAAGRAVERLALAGAGRGVAGKEGGARA